LISKNQRHFQKRYNPFTVSVSTRDADQQDEQTSDRTASYKCLNDNDKKRFLIHKGRSAAMIKRSPALAGVTLCKGWSATATAAFVAAVEETVRRNPILSGHVYEVKDRPWSSQGELWVESGAFTPGNHSFVRIVPAPNINNANKSKTLDLSTMNATELVKYTSTELFPLLGECKLTSKQMQDRLPLFGATLMILDDTHAVFSLKMSHCVGDGNTFFHLVKHVSMIMSGRPVAAINWDCAAKATHEFYPDTFSNRDVQIAYGAPFLLGALKNVLLERQHRQASYILLDKLAVNAVKRVLRQERQRNDISSNDVITAALCQGNRATDVFVFTENMRGKLPGIPVGAAGNFLWEVPVPREICSQPDRLRTAVATINGHGYQTNELPLQPFVCGRVGRVTSLASIAENVLFDGVETVCTLPFASFLADIPLDVAVIFRFNKQYWAVLHNFAELNMNGLLQDAQVE
jgi:hypothetical protein